MEPLISIKIPTYNCAQYLIQTIESVLNQKMININVLDIEVIDDCSTKDDPEDIVKRHGQGRVKFYKNATNQGATANFNTCIYRSNCQFTHILHGDDFIEESFYFEFLEKYAQDEKLSIFTVRNYLVDEAGNKFGESICIKNEELNELFEGQTPFQFSGVVFRTEIAKQIGGFDNQFIHFADRDLWLRLCLLGDWYHSNLILANYRVFQGNDSSKLYSLGFNLVDYYKFLIKHKKRFRLNIYQINLKIYKKYRNQVLIFPINKRIITWNIIKTINIFWYFFELKSFLRRIKAALKNL